MWLLDPDSNQVQYKNTAENPLITTSPLIHPEVGLTRTESAMLDHGIYIFRTTVKFIRKPSVDIVNFADVVGDASETSFMARSVESGHCLQFERFPESIVECRPGVDLFRYANKFRFLASVRAEGSLDCTSLCIYKSALDRLLGKDIADKILYALNISVNPSIVSRAVPRSVSVPLRHALGIPFDGKMKLLAAQGRVLEYLSFLCTFILGNQNIEKEKRVRQQIIAALHNEIVSLEGKLPTLSDLATKYGLSVRSLNEEFKQQHGMTISNFMADHRLQSAHRALIHTSIPIKVLSARIGYSHVNHFTNAFSRKFGYPPGKLRGGSV